MFKKLYNLQKKIVKEIQDKVFAYSRKRFVNHYRKHYEDVCLSIEKKVPFIGKIVADTLRRYKEEILEALI